ncbi:MAG: ankyrin repeat domain-containing protein [Phycisphaerales bacterium]|nr:ankyrin repeat domain-containing protein [Phycisphaerales bacterium]
MARMKNTWLIIAGALIILAIAVGVFVFVSRQGSIALHEAVADGNLTEVRRLLDRGVSPSASHRNLGLPDVNVKMVRREVAFLEAASSGHTEIVRLMLDRGADIELANEWGRTALTFSAQNDRLDTTALLIERGANVMATDEKGFAPLIWAAMSGSPEMVALLLDAGATDRAGPGGRTALSTAAYRNEPEKSQIEALLAPPDPRLWLSRDALSRY